jgi:hypothetical protein
MRIMTLERFTQLAEVFGSDLHAWPEPHRKEGLAFLMESPDARLIWREFQTLDRLVQESAPSPAADQLVDLIVNRAEATRQAYVEDHRNVKATRSLAYWSVQAAAFAGVFLLGMALGLTVPSIHFALETQPDIVSLVYDPTRMGGWTP